MTKAGKQGRSTVCALIRGLERYRSLKLLKKMGSQSLVLISGRKLSVTEPLARPHLGGTPVTFISQTLVLSSVL